MAARVVTVAGSVVLAIINTNSSLSSPVVADSRRIVLLVFGPVAIANGPRPTTLLGRLFGDDRRSES